MKIDGFGEVNKGQKMYDDNMGQSIQEWTK